MNLTFVLFLQLIFETFLVDRQCRKTLSEHSRGGARVTKVDPSCEFRNRIVPGDVLVTVNGNVVRTAGDITEGSGGSRRLEFKVRRPGGEAAAAARQSRWAEHPGTNFQTYSPPQNQQLMGLAMAASQVEARVAAQAATPANLLGAAAPCWQQQFVSALARQYLENGTNPVTGAAQLSAGAPVARNVGPDDGLPEGWAARETWSGRTYYFNRSTSETSWTKPVLGKEMTNASGNGPSASSEKSKAGSATTPPKRRKSAATPSTGTRVTRSSARTNAVAAKDDATESLTSFSVQLEEVAAAAAGDGGTMRTRRRAYERPSPPKRKRVQTDSVADGGGPRAKKARTDGESRTATKRKKWSTYTDQATGRKYYWDGNVVTWDRPAELGEEEAPPAAIRGKSAEEVTAAGARLALAAPPRGPPSGPRRRAPRSRSRSTSTCTRR